MKIAFISGAAIRIGRGLAEAMLEDSFHLILHANNSFAELEAWVNKSPYKNQVIACLKGRLDNALGQDELCHKIKQHCSHLDVVIHNASAFYPENYSQISRESFRLMLGINLEAPFFITQNLLPLLKKAQNPSVINILDAMWEKPSKNFSHYAVSKAGLAILTRALAKELAPQIRVNALAPGAIIFQDFHSQETKIKTLSKIALSRLGTTQEIAHGVKYLIEASYVTGEILMIDGGRSIG